MIRGRPGRLLCRLSLLVLMAGCGDDAPALELDTEMRGVLEALTVEQLTEELGSWLNAEQIGAVVVRRDRLLGGLHSEPE